MNDNVIYARSVSKTYPGKGNYLKRWLGIKEIQKGTVAVKNLNMTIKKGQFYGLLGPNGAGKTTIIRMLSGILRPDSGDLLIDGKNIFQNEKHVKSKIGVVLGGDRALYWKLTGEENLKFFASLYELDFKEVKKDIDKVLKYVGLIERKDDYVEEYSKGMKQRLLIAKSLLHKPKVLLLDEPTVGLDVESARELHKLLVHLNKDLGVSIVLTTHYLQEAEQLCDQIGILKEGQIIIEGTPTNLKELVKNENIIELKVKNVSNVDLPEVLYQLEFVNRIVKANKDLDNTITYGIYYQQFSNMNAVKAILGKIMELVEVVSIETKLPTIEDVFIKLAGKGV